MEVKKGEEFKNYLSKAGVVDQITRGLVGLYQEPIRPHNALDFMRKYLNSNSDIDVVKLKQEYDNIVKQNKDYTEEIEQLQVQLEVLLSQQQLQEQ